MSGEPPALLPPVGLPPRHELFVFEVLGPEHNGADLAAWSSSIDHIRATPGFGRPWPERPYTTDENLADLTEHRDHHERRLDYAWTVLDPDDRSAVIGCVYLKPDPTGRSGATGSSWVRASHAHLDAPLVDHLAPWFASLPMGIAYR